MPIASMELAGGFVIRAPPFDAVVPIITLDKETGIGHWTDQRSLSRPVPNPRL
jgi:hypothetical protein